MISSVPFSTPVLRYTENRQRKAFTRNEEARVYRALMEGFGLSKAEVARRLSVSESEVSRALAVDEKLPEDVRGKVAAGAIGVSVAYELTKVADPDRQRALAALAEQGATREEVAAEVKRVRAAAGDVVARRKAPASRRPVSVGRKEFALAGGGRVTLTGPAAAGPDAWVAALREALTLAEGETLPTHREDQGEAA